MAKVATTKAKPVGSKTDNSTRGISRKLVAVINKFAEIRSTANLYNKLVDEGRVEIFAEVGKVEQTLTHNGVVVAVIAKVEKSYIDLDYLAEKHPKAYADSLRKRDEFHIRKPAPQK